MPINLLPTLPIRALHHDVLELHGHRVAGVDLKADGGGARVGGVGVIGRRNTVEPDLEAVAAGTDTQRIPLAFLEEGSDALAAAGLRVDIAFGAGVETAGHVNLEGVGLAQLHLQLRLAQEDPGIYDASPYSSHAGKTPDKIHAIAPAEGLQMAS
jgi:hypothetical protein